MSQTIDILRRSGIQPTPQRIAVVEFVLATRAHPSADEVFATVKATCPTVSRATVHNPFNLLVQKGLLRQQILREGIVLYDPHVARHYHFIDEGTGEIHDVPWDAVRVSGTAGLEAFDVRDFQVVMRGRHKA